MAKPVVDAAYTPNGVGICQMNDCLWINSACCQETVIFVGGRWGCSGCSVPLRIQPHSPLGIRSFYRVPNDPWGSIEEWIFAWAGMEPSRYKLEIS